MRAVDVLTLESGFAHAPVRHCIPSRTSVSSSARTTAQSFPSDVAMMTLGKLQRVNADTHGDTVRCKCSPTAMLRLRPS